MNLKKILGLMLAAALMTPACGNGKSAPGDAEGDEAVPDPVESIDPASDDAGPADDLPAPEDVESEEDPFLFVPSTDTGIINWEGFPEFHLPPRLVAVYQGPHFGSSANEPLRHGFTHIANSGTTDEGRALLAPENRAVLWTGVAGIEGSPWREALSPWGNDMDAYEARWGSYMRAYANWSPDTEGLDMPDVDILCADIEKHLTADDEILALRTHGSTPADVAALDDGAFVDRYRRDMAALYDAPLSWVLDAGYAGTLTSYSDVPIRRTWWGIDDRTWAEWLADPLLVSYLVRDPSVAGDAWLETYGPFYHHQDILTPSSYFFYDYPETRDEDPARWNSAGDYLAYLLFQIEANLALSDREALVFYWMDFHDCCDSAGRSVRPHMAHAAAIFNYVAGARGAWLWDHQMDGNTGDPDKLYAMYEWYVYGLYRLTLFPDFFDGTALPCGADDAVTLMNENLPLWRGLVRGGSMLVAAHNPYAVEGETTRIEIEYEGSVVGEVDVPGLDTWLGVLELP